VRLTDLRPLAGSVCGNCDRSAISNDVRYALRGLRCSPRFALVAIFSLGLAIGVNIAMFALVDAILRRPIPIAAPATLVDVFTSSSDGDEYGTTSYPDFLDLKAQTTVFQDMTAYTPMFPPLGLGDRSRLVTGQIVTRTDAVTALRTD
jgi:hypothetical protein